MGGNNRIYHEPSRKNEGGGGISCEFTVWKVSKYGVFSGPYFPVSSRNTGECGPEKTPCLDTFHVMVT